MAFAGRILVYGGKGALGCTIVSFFKARDFWVGNIDLRPNEDADANVAVTPVESWVEQEKQVLDLVGAITDAGTRFDAILCVAGGWAGGAASSPDFVKNADLMWKQSVWSTSIAAKLASKYLKPGGLLTLPGAKPCLDGTPGMMGYGMAKAAVHQLTKSLGDAEKSGLPAGSVTVAVLPITLDTPMNRKWMAGADTSTWTSLEFMADLFFAWTTDSGKPGRPASGSLMEVVTVAGETSVTAVG